MTEEQDPAREEFGEERLSELLVEKAQLGATALVEEIRTTVLAWAAGAPAADDRHGPDRAPPPVMAGSNGVQEFRPAFWLPGRHAQTIVPSVLPAVPLRGRAETLDVPVGPRTAVRVVLHRPAGVPRGTVVAIHGLAGSAESRYMRRTGRWALARGWAVASVNLRNCGGTELLASTLYNAGQSAC